MLVLRRSVYILILTVIIIVITIAGLEFGSKSGGATVEKVIQNKTSNESARGVSKPLVKPEVNITVSVVDCNYTLYKFRCVGVSGSSILGLIRNSSREYGVRIENLSCREYNGVLEVVFASKAPVWVSDGECYLDASWILSIYSLDLIENGFRETNHSLSWSGVVNNTLVNIEFILPAQNKSYAAWGYPVGHCHAHIWWPLGD